MKRRDNLTKALSRVDTCQPYLPNCDLDCEPYSIRSLPDYRDPASVQPQVRALPGLGDAKVMINKQSRAPRMGRFHLDHIRC